MLQPRCPDWQWNGECHIAIMGKGERGNKRGREGGEIYSSPTGKQNTAICSGRTDWNDYSERNIQFWDSFPSTPPHLSWSPWMLWPDWERVSGGTTVTAKTCLYVWSISDPSWFVRRAVTDEKVHTKRISHGGTKQLLETTCVSVVCMVVSDWASQKDDGAHFYVKLNW